MIRRPTRSTRTDTLLPDTTRFRSQTLTPARDEHGELDRVKLESNGLQAIQTAIDQYREHRRKLLLDERIAELEVDREGARQETLHLATIVENEFQKLTDLQRQKLNMGADVLVRLEEDIKAAEAAKPTRHVKLAMDVAACEAMGWAVPDSVVCVFQCV